MTQPRRRVLDPLAEFLRTEAAAGAVLIAAAVAALAWANLGSSYATVWDHQLLGHSIQHWVNDGLMTVFFFVVALEIKREFVHGELRDRRTAITPIAGAIGGMVVPACVYLAINLGGATRGWGIPIATDIAFAISVLALLGARVAPGLRLFLLTLAIVDDLGAILVIALAYSTKINAWWLLEAVALLALVIIMRRFASSPWWYVVPGFLLWFGVYESGVHATIAGVVLGLCTPIVGRNGTPVLERLETALHPWVSYVIIPIFALANAGVVLGGGALAAAFASPVTRGVILGLVIGKPVGVLVGVALGRLAGGRMPDGVPLGQIAGAAVLAGIGFTVSLFITDLAFSSPVAIDHARVGVLAGSLAAGVVGAAALWAKGRSPTTRARIAQTNG
ncbi:MAG: Na+/H+ antiporter NhaA [Acidimicrobiia bacterium]